jgi:hypothetical protein
MEVGQIITLLSGAGIGAVLSAILMFINNSKRNQLDYITRERSEWRREIKSVIVDLLSGNNRCNAISRLKTQLNPYGKYIEESKYEFYMNDGHIWKLVDNFDYSSKNVKILTRYLEILLKYDWERSKREVNYSYNSALYKVFNIFITIILLSLFLLMKGNWFDSKIMAIFGFVFPFFVIIVYSAFIPKILELLKHHKVQQVLEKLKNTNSKKNINLNWLHYLLLFVPYLFLAFCLIYIGDRVISSQTLIFLNRRIVIAISLIYISWLLYYLIGKKGNSLAGLEIEYIKNINKENTHV